MGFLHTFASQFLVSESASKVGSDHTEAVTVRDKVFFGSAVVVAKHLFVKVAEKMKRLNRNVSPFQSAFQETPEVFESVRVDLPLHVRFSVVNDLVNVVLVQSVVCSPIVRRELRPRLNIFFDDGLHHLPLTVVYNFGSNFSTTFKDSNHDGLSACTVRSNLCALALVHEAGLTADKSLIYFDVPGQFSLETQRLHGLADSVHHEPRRFLCDSDSAVNLIRANAVLRCGQHPRCRKPFVQRKRRVLIDRSRFRGELPFRMMASALPLALILEEGCVFAATDRASNAIGPKASDHVVKAVVGIAEIYDRFLKRLRFFVCVLHGSRVPESGGFVKYILTGSSQ